MKNNVKKIVRFVFSNALGYFFIWFGFVRRERHKAVSSGLITSIYFHNPEKRLFESCVRWLIKNKYTFISVDDLVSILNNNKPLPDLAVLITFDDAYKNNISNVFPVSEKYRIPVTFFAPTDSIETGEYWWRYVYDGIAYASKEYKNVEDFKKVPESKRKEQIELIKKKISIPKEAMTIEELKMIAKSPLVGIGSHSVNHPCTVHCTDEELEFELKISKQKLESWLGKEVPYFAYPNGDFNQRDKGYLKKFNYRLSFTTVPEFIFPEKFDFYELPRFCIIPNASFAENICRMTGIWQKFFLKFRFLK